MTQSNTNTELADLLAPHSARAEQDLDRWTVEPGTPDSLAAAMRYCAMGGGKRLRPALVYLSCEAAGGEIDELTRRAAVAIELVHTYSLVHDDLPAMDDDTLRRGRATAHVKFGEAMAVLAGDALLTRALALPAEPGDPRSAAMVAELAHAAGPAGMIAGQVADMDLCDLADGVAGLEYIHLRKTAAMIRGACRLGAIAAKASEEVTDALGRFAEKLGLAFQVFDDLLDVTASAKQLGKTPGKDAETGKRTYVSLLGVDGAREAGNQLTRQALDALDPLGRRKNKLSRLARLLTDRQH
ncbi:MAG: polyprenyl synthetase family protein [Phycisphaerae bacterium]